MKITYEVDKDGVHEIWLSDDDGNSVLLAEGTPKSRAPLYRQAQARLTIMAEKCGKRAEKGKQ